MVGMAIFFLFFFFTKGILTEIKLLLQFYFNRIIYNIITFNNYFSVFDSFLFHEKNLGNAGRKIRNVSNKKVVFKIQVLSV